ncbi:ATP-binding cassette domain-containing protein [Paenibacillus sp. MCAF20]
MSELAVQVTGLRKTYGKQVVLDGIELAVSAGTIFALLGPNGAGKTTLIHILTTLVAADEGIARVFGSDVANAKNAVKSAISLTGQFAAIDEMLTGEENLRMIGRLSGLSPSQSRARAAELLESFDLTAAAGKRVKSYSGGMRRRLDLATSLVVDRPILFLDEPTTGLDTTSRRALWTIILSLKQRGVTIFLTTQYLEEADQLADTVAVISGGRIVATGTPGQLKSRVGTEVLELRDENDALIRSIPTDGTLQHLRQLINDPSLMISGNAKLSLRKPSMDDVFLALTTTQLEAVTL